MLLNPHAETKMLASVVSLDEAKLVIEAGADIVDLKNPIEGALGALPLSIVQSIVDGLGHQTIISATIGDQPMNPELLVSKTREMLATGADIVKIGFFGNQHHQACLQALKDLAGRQAKLVAVMFADSKPNLNLLDDIAQSGFYGVMLDTAHKNGKDLLDYFDLDELSLFVSRAKELGLCVGLAGALKHSQVRALLSIQPSYLGFRSALCDARARTSNINTAQVRSLVEEMRQGAQASLFVNKAQYDLIERHAYLNL